MLQVHIDVRDYARMAKRFQGAGRNIKPALGRAVRHTGNKARTQVVRALTGQTGLKRKTIVKAVRKRSQGLTYELRSRGGNVSLKHFAARETRKGVSAAPWNKRRIYARTFLKGGRFPNRVPLSRGGGHVFARSGKGRLPIAKQKSGLFIPKEMVTGASAAAFNNVASTELPSRLAHEVRAILAGYAP